MNWIGRILDGIRTAFETLIPPFADLPPMLLLCEINMMPGLSPIVAFGEIGRQIQTVGIPTGECPCGMENVVMKSEYVRMQRIFENFKNQALVMGVIEPGTVMSFGTGGNAGGPVEVQSVNPYPIIFLGIVE